MPDWDLLKDLDLVVEECAFERLERHVSSDFLRVTTVIRLRGGGHEGIAEDVVYDAEDHDAAQASGPPPGLRGRWTLERFCARVQELDLFPRPPVREVSRLYRVNAWETAALDLALRQAGVALHDAVGRIPRPVTFVVSLRLGEPPSIDPVARRLERYPSLRFKLDPTASWTDELVEQLAATGAVDSVDFKGFYTNTIVENPPDAAMYERVLRAFPAAWIEDPHDTPQIAALLEPHRDRVSYDAPIHGIADIESVPIAPRMVNVKPSRVGPLRELFATYAYCQERNIGMYGGGQFELGPGRGQIQLLASLYHPDTPNDVSPAAFHVPDPPPGLPESPLPPAPDAVGFRWTA